MIITIDGPAGAGKSTISKALAKRISFTYLDTGALYRAVAFKADQERISPDDEPLLADLCKRINISLSNVDDQLRIFVDKDDVTDKLRKERISLLASRISAIPAVRSALLPIQRKAAENRNIVAEGRDMGTVVFPNADYKFYLDASIDERARRRYKDVSESEKGLHIDDVKKDIKNRDGQDSSRITAPLKVPDNAIIIDSTELSISTVVDKMTIVIQHPS
jgi:CMP/dCMP kinase